MRNSVSSLRHRLPPFGDTFERVAVLSSGLGHRAGLGAEDRKKTP
jgi:hypothetical protein